MQENSSVPLGKSHCSSFWHLDSLIQPVVLLGGEDEGRRDGGRAGEGWTDEAKEGENA